MSKILPLTLNSYSTTTVETDLTRICLAMTVKIGKSLMHFPSLQEIKIRSIYKPKKKKLDSFETRKSRIVLMMMMNLIIFWFLKITINNSYQFCALELKLKGHLILNNIKGWTIKFNVFMIGVKLYIYLYIYPLYLIFCYVYYLKLDINALFCVLGDTQGIQIKRRRKC